MEHAYEVGSFKWLKLRTEEISLKKQANRVIRVYLITIKKKHQILRPGAVQFKTHSSHVLNIFQTSRLYFWYFLILVSDLAHRCVEVLVCPNI